MNNLEKFSLGKPCIFHWSILAFVFNISLDLGKDSDGGFRLKYEDMRWLG